MPTLFEYALIADAAYSPSDSTSGSQGELSKLGWKCPTEMQVNDKSVFSGGSLTSSGFQGRMFLAPDNSHAVIGYKGTKPQMTSDLVADIKLAMGFVPTQAKDALKATQDWSKQVSGKTVTLAGHSLGGALAQVVGQQTGLHFVTFNAPGMLRQANGLSSSQTADTNALKGKLDDLGLNLRTGGSFAPIAGLGVHIGKVQVYELADPGHSISIFVDYLRKNSSEGKRVPF